MLARKNRISSEEIKNTIKSGNSFHTDNFYGKFSLGGTKNLRFTVVSSIKVEKKSTKRHLLKRRIVYIIGNYVKKYPQILKKSFDLVIFSKKKALSLNFSQISLEINKILEHISKPF